MLHIAVIILPRYRGQEMSFFRRKNNGKIAEKEENNFTMNGVLVDEKISLICLIREYGKKYIASGIKEKYPLEGNAHDYMVSFDWYDTPPLFCVD